MPILRPVALGLAAIAALAVGLFLALSWSPDRPLPELAARWAQSPSQFVPLEGMNVHVRDEGLRNDPLPIILLHGTASNLHTWDGWAARLAPTRRVIRMDLPGFGLTGPAPDGDYTPARYGRFVLDLMNRLAVPRAELVGNSLGGGIAWLIAAWSPDRVARLVLIDAAGYPQQSTSVPIGLRLAGVPGLSLLFNHILPQGVIEASLRSVYGDPDRVTPALVNEYTDMALREGNRQALARRLAQARFDQLSKEIHKVNQPTLILWGALDHLIPPVAAERFHADITDSRVMLLPGLGHVPQEEDPAASLSAASAFLQGGG